MVYAKSEECPRCAVAGPDWHYDAQRCGRCFYPDRYREIMRAEAQPDLYAVPPTEPPPKRWVGSGEGDKDGDGDIGGTIGFAAESFAPGTRVIVQEPECPTCCTPRSLCECGFDWSRWDQRYA